MKTTYTLYICTSKKLKVNYLQVMALFGEPQWCVVGDTFPVGCKWAESIVYRDTSFEGNPDGENKLYKYVNYFLAPFLSSSTFGIVSVPNMACTHRTADWITFSCPGVTTSISTGY